MSIALTLQVKVYGALDTVFLDQKIDFFSFFFSVHKIEESLFTSTSGFDHYRGILNLCIVLMVRFIQIHAVFISTVTRPQATKRALTW